MLEDTFIYILDIVNWIFSECFEVTQSSKIEIFSEVVSVEASCRGRHNFIFFKENSLDINK